MASREQNNTRDRSRHWHHCITKCTNRSITTQTNNPQLTNISAPANCRRRTTSGKRLKRQTAANMQPKSTKTSSNHQTTARAPSRAQAPPQEPPTETQKQPQHDGKPPAARAIEPPRPTAKARSSSSRTRAQRRRGEGTHSSSRNSTPPRPPTA